MSHRELLGQPRCGLFGAALNVVTTRKLLGANYRFLVVLPWANNRLQGVDDFDAWNILATFPIPSIRLP